MRAPAAPSGVPRDETTSVGQDEIRLLRAELTVARTAVTRAEIERDAAVALAEEYREQLRNLASSASWRMTRPYRGLRRVLGRLRSRRPW